MFIWWTLVFSIYGCGNCKQTRYTCWTNIKRVKETLQCSILFQSGNHAGIKLISWQLKADLQFKRLGFDILSSLSPWASMWQRCAADRISKAEWSYRARLCHPYTGWERRGSWEGCKKRPDASPSISRVVLTTWRSPWYKLMNGEALDVKVVPGQESQEVIALPRHHKGMHDIRQ